MFIKKNPAWNDKVPKTWFKVKKELSQMFLDGKKDFITTNDFEVIAKKCNIENKDFKSMRSALSALGICLYYEKIKELDMHILNPNWITTGIYAIIAWLRSNQDYKIKLSDLNMVFINSYDKYPENKHIFLFKLLEIYNLAYQYKSEEDGDVLVIPILLTEQQPERNMESDFPVSDSLCMRYRAESELPSDTISRFIVCHHQKIMKKNGKQIVWRKGVKLIDKTGNVGLIKEVDREIMLYIRGSNAKIFLSELRDTLNVIFKTYKSKYPKLEYKIAVTQDNEPIYADDGTIVGYMINNKTYFEPRIGGNIYMENIVNEYNMDIRDVAIGGSTIKKIKNSPGAEIDVNNFYFNECNIQLQGNLNSLIDLLKENSKENEAITINSILSDIEKLEKIDNKEKIIKSGLLVKLTNFLKDVGNENSSFRKIISGIQYGKEILSQIVNKYNLIAKWIGLPQTHPIIDIMLK